MRSIPCSRMITAVCRSWMMAPCRSGSSSSVCPSTVACRGVAVNREKPGEASSASRKRSASRVSQGTAKVLGCVAFRMNS